MNFVQWGCLPKRQHLSILHSVENRIDEAMLSFFLPSLCKDIVFLNFFLQISLLNNVAHPISMKLFKYQQKRMVIDSKLSYWGYKPTDSELRKTEESTSFFNRHLL